jgi:hypothetical protein
MKDVFDELEKQRRLTDLALGTEYKKLGLLGSHFSELQKAIDGPIAEHARLASKMAELTAGFFPLKRLDEALGAIKIAALPQIHLPLLAVERQLVGHSLLAPGRVLRSHICDEIPDVPGQARPSAF